MVGTRLGNYSISSKLGEGGMGEVWRARDERLNRSVALKILPQDVASDPTRRARFQQEARALAALNHPNIVAVYDAGQDNGQAYIVSELVDGESLRAIIDRGRQPLRRVIEIAVQIADALAAAHAAGVVHRDLKPENVMLTRDGRVKVLDFGLAKQKTTAPSENTATAALSEPGMVMGTAGYMSPEQVRGEPLDHRSDIFSFGCVLYEMVAGKRAFQADSSVETMHAILHDEPADIAADPQLAPPALAAIVRRCLEKQPDNRFQSAADLAFALRSISLSTTTAPALSKPVGKRRWIVPALLAVAGVALFAVGFLLRSVISRREAPTFQRVTFRTGLVTNARFTTDGRNIVYSANWEGRSGHIYLATPGNPDARDLDLPEGSILLSVSPNEEIAFLMGPFSPDGSGTLSRSSISGGQMRPWLDGVRNADWMPDGSSMAVYRSVNGKFRLEFPIGNVVLDDLHSGIMLGMRVSPDGKYVVFGRFDKNNTVALDIVDRSGKRRTLGVVSGETPDVIDPVLSWSPDGREIWFRSFDLKEWGTIYAIDLQGQQRIVTRLPGHITAYDIARNGKVLLRTDTRQVGILGMAPGDTMERDLSCLDNADLTGISDDGRFVVATIIGESGGPKGSVYLRKTDGSPPVRLADGAAFALSPDGKWVSGYYSIDPQTRQYVLIPTGAGEELKIVIPKLGNLGLVYGWSQDDQTLYLHGPGEKNKNQMQNYSWNPSTGAVHAIGPEGVADDLAMLAPDRRQILDIGPDGRFWIYPVDGGEPRPVNGLGHHDRIVGWRADNRSLYIATHHDVNKTISVSVLDLGTGQSTPWKEIHPSRPVDDAGTPRITPDGRAWAYNFRVKQSDLYVAGGLQ